MEKRHGRKSFQKIIIERRNPNYEISQEEIKKEGTGKQKYEYPRFLRYKDP